MYSPTKAWGHSYSTSQIATDLLGTPNFYYSSSILKRWTHCTFSFLQALPVEVRIELSSMQDWMERCNCGRGGYYGKYLNILTSSGFMENVPPSVMLLKRVGNSSLKLAKGLLNPSTESTRPTWTNPAGQE